MASQTDLDQGGTVRGWVRQYLGPSVGWIYVPQSNVLNITAAGSYTLDPSTNVVLVNVAGSVTITLPSAITPAAGAQAQPGLFAQNPITIVDIGGHGNANPVTINPHGSETILGLSSITLSVNYGGYTLLPSTTQQGWTSISP